MLAISKKPHLTTYTLQLVQLCDTMKRYQK